MAKNQVAPQAAQVPARVVSGGIQTISEEEFKQMEGVEGAGLSDNVEDRGTPLLYIAQKGSPQVEERDAKYIPGLKAGMAFNHLTGEIYDAEHDGVPFLPCFMRTTWDEWTPRDQGGGFHGSHLRNSPITKQGKPFVTKKNKTRRDIIVLPNGHELKLTEKYYGVIPTTWTPIIVPMASTSLGAATRLQALIGAQKVAYGNRIIIKPGYHTVFNLKTTFEHNDDGNWFQWAVSIEGPNDNAELKEMCRQFAIACKDNAVKEAAPIDSDTGGPAPNDGDIPI